VTKAGVTVLGVDAEEKATLVKSVVIMVYSVGLQRQWLDSGNSEVVSLAAKTI
jgi:hypothetical protein